MRRCQAWDRGGRNLKAGCERGREGWCFEAKVLIMRTFLMKVLIMRTFLMTVSPEGGM